MSKAAAAKKAKKGLSMEEKTEKILAWFRAHPQPYTLKELLVLIPRATGVIYQSVEECLELIVSENHNVFQDKVGVHTLFWCFPLTATQKQDPTAACARSRQDSGATATAAERTRRLELQQRPLEDLRAEVAAAAARDQQLQEQLEAAAAAVGSEEEIKQHAMRLTRLTQQSAQLLERRKQLALVDPDVKRKLHRSIQSSLEAANQWTENFFLLEEYIKDKMQRSSRDVRSSVSVPDQLDFIEAEDILPPSPPQAVQPPAPRPVSHRPQATVAATTTGTHTLPGEGQQPQAMVDPGEGEAAALPAASPSAVSPPYTVASASTPTAAVPIPTKRGRKAAAPKASTGCHQESTAAAGDPTTTDGQAPKECRISHADAAEAGKANRKIMKTTTQKAESTEPAETTAEVSWPPPPPIPVKAKRENAKGAERKRTRGSTPPPAPSLAPSEAAAATRIAIPSETGGHVPSGLPQQKATERSDGWLINLLAQVEREEEQATARETKREEPAKKRRGRPSVAPKK